MQVKTLLQKIFKPRIAKEVNPVQHATIICLESQTPGVDYYNIDLNGTYFHKVPCPISSWLAEQLEEEIAFGAQITETRKINLSRTPLFKSGETVQVLFEGGNKQAMKISIEESGIKYAKLEIVII